MSQNKTPFNQYFNEWLYGDNGYYSNYKVIGKHGDFYTSVSTSKFFGGSIGKRVVEIIEEGFLNEYQRKRSCDVALKLMFITYKS